ncbi:MAG: ABC transporter permease [Chitinophagaceae bacterium]|nr:MAG: ABC transporter permease [Chitinophagaceae bacterium]
MQYSQLRAMLAITRASFRSIMRSPSAVVFSFVFPFIFILVFGFIGNSGGGQTYRVLLDKRSDTSNAFYTALKSNSNIRFVQYKDSLAQKLDIQKGRLAGNILILKNDSTGLAPYDIKLTSASSSADKWPQLKAVIENTITNVSNKVYPGRPTYASFNFDPARDIATIREYKTIDFILPGQLGFSLLSSGVFGVAFMFYNLRSTLVLKRFFATPISRPYIILGESFSRVIFQMLTAIVIIGAGYLFFDFTLVNGLRTFAEMLFLSFLGLLLFMGFGFIVSGLAKSDSTIPPFANLITMPQFLMGGTFFSIDAFPKWLQPISRALPLTHLNDAMRSVAFEGHNLWDVRNEIGYLLIWTVVVYAIATKVFKWE